jgi:putative endonuclease
MFYVYALCSRKDGHLYIGISSDPDKRLKEHNSGMTKSLLHRRPLEMIYKEACENRVNARKREKTLKSGSGREFLKKFIPR